MCVHTPWGRDFVALPWVLRFYSSKELASDTDAAGQQQTMLGVARNSTPVETPSISSLAAIRFLTAGRILIFFEQQCMCSTLVRNHAGTKLSPTILSDKHWCRECWWSHIGQCILRRGWLGLLWCKCHFPLPLVPPLYLATWGDTPRGRGAILVPQDVKNGGKRAHTVDKSRGEEKGPRSKVNKLQPRDQIQASNCFCKWTFIRGQPCPHLWTTHGCYLTQLRLLKQKTRPNQGLKPQKLISHSFKRLGSLRSRCQHIWRGLEKRAFCLEDSWNIAESWHGGGYRSSLL